MSLGGETARYGRARVVFAARGTGYCRPAAMPINIRLTRKDPYDVEGTFIK